MFRAISSRAIGYAIAVFIMVPLAWWAKRDATGMWMLAAVVIVTFVAMMPYRLRHGVWPGDEHLLDKTREERRRRDRPGYVFIAVMIVLCIALAICAQPHAR